MKPTQPINNRYASPILRLESSTELNAISNPEDLFLLEDFSVINIRPFVFQSGNSKDSSSVVEHEGSEALGANVTNALDGEVVTSKPPEHRDLMTLLRRPNRDGFIHDVNDFLARPFIHRSGTLASTDNANTFAYDSCFDPLCASNMYISKLRGAYSFRATTHYTLQINGNRMQQGRYLLAFMPTGGMKPGTKDFDAFYKMHRYSKTEITQLRHINLDVNCDTEGTIEIPYVSNFPGWMFNAASPYGSSGDPGVVFMYPYQPLVSVTGTTTAGYQLIVHYTDVQIDGVGVAQMGRIKSKGRDVVYEESVSNRPISTALNSLTVLAKGLSSIPLLTPFAVTSAIVTDALANAAYTFGWSKPLNLSEPRRVRTEQFPYLAVTDAHDTSDNLAVNVSNHVGVIGGFSETDQDELSIDFIKKIPAFITTFDWTTTGSSGDTLASISVFPGGPINTSDTKNTISSWVPTAYLLKMYTFWRGSLTYTLKFTKTEFHSGRLIIRFIPFDNISYGDPGLTANNKPYMLKAIVDLRECNQFTFTVPFIYNKVWADCDYTGTFGTVGKILIEVLDRLVAPSNVSSTINVAVEVSGGDDLEFAVPATGVTSSAYNQENPHKHLTAVVPFIFQSGRNDCSIGEVVIGNSKISSTSPQLSGACFGEVSRSLRQILKRGGLWPSTKQINNNTSNAFIAPRYITYGISQTGSVAGYTMWDPYNVIAPLYHSMRGGMRIKGLSAFGGTVPDHTVVVSCSVRRYIDGPALSPLSGNTNTWEQWLDNTMGGAMSKTQCSDGGFAVQVPQYLNVPAYCVGEQLYNGVNDTTKGTKDPMELNIQVFGAEGGGTSIPNIYIHRSVADDFNLAGFVSVPCTAEMA